MPVVGRDEVEDVYDRGQPLGHGPLEAALAPEVVPEELQEGEARLELAEAAVPHEEVEDLHDFQLDGLAMLENIVLPVEHLAFKAVSEAHKVLLEVLTDHLCFAPHEKVAPGEDLYLAVADDQLFHQCHFGVAGIQ